MREILFRGKTQNIMPSRWVYGSLTDVGHKWFIDDYKDNSRVITETIGQYTELKDKNEEKIFEGDIVKVYFNTFDDNGYILSTEIVIGEVYFDNNEYSYKVLQNLGIFNDGSFEDYNSIPLYKCINCEVIGNKHDTPELLTQQHEDKGVRK